MRTRHRTLPETIPATSSVILHADADRALKMAGCHSHAGSIELTADIKALLSHDYEALCLLAASARLGSEIDLTRLYAFCYDSCWIVTAPISNPATDLLDGRSCKVTGVGRAYATAVDDVSVVATDEQAWLGCCPPDSLTIRIANAISAADHASMSQYAAISGFLPQPDHLLEGYVAMPLVHNPMGQDYNSVLVTVDGSDRQLSARIKPMRNGFAVDAADSLQAISPAALAYMPGGTMASFAIGLDRGTLARLMPWARQLPLQSQLAVNAIIALADLDGGTMALALAPGGSAETIKRLTLDNWLFKAVLPIADKGEDIGAIVGKVLNDNLYSASDSAYLDITNYDPETYPAQYQASVIPGASMQARLEIDYRSQVMKAFGLTSGYLAEAWMADSVLCAKVRVQGPSQYLLPVLLNDLNKIRP